MKKTLVALATLSAVTAFAQSAVTISGIINYGVYRSGASPNAQTFGAIKGDRNNLTFDVKEDMGGGTNAIAKMQFRFDSSNGVTGYASQSGYEYSNSASLMEQTMVGMSTSMGTVKFGRFTNDLGTYDYSVFEDAKTGTNASHALYGRLSSTAQYTSPSIAGFTVSFINAKSAANCWGSPGGATGGGLITGINYCTYSATGSTNFGSSAVTYTNGPLLAQAAAISGLYGDKNTRIGVRYTLGNGTNIYYGSFKQDGAIGKLLSTNSQAYGTFPVATSTSYGIQAHTSTELGVSVPLGAITLRAAYLTNNNDLGISSGSNITDGTTKVSKTSLGGEYSLSKRTMLMVQGGKVSNSTTALAANGSVWTTGTSYFAGLQHSF